MARTGKMWRRQNRENRWRSESVSSRSVSKWLGWPKQKAVSKRLAIVPGQRWLTGNLEVRLDSTGHM